jgi:hypothetical protein
MILGLTETYHHGRAIRMKILSTRLAIGTGVVLMLLAASTVFAAAGTQNFTGTVSDAMCGAKHEMEGSPAECTRACVGKGSKYALVVGDKVYTLDTTDKAALSTLDQRAGASVTVKGTADGDTIHVASVSEAK